MYIAIDTSGETSGLALVQAGRIAAELSWQCSRNHTVELLPRIDDMLRQNHLKITDIRGIIVARGPGSFNGLRVGLGSSKGIAYGLNVPIIGISTLEATAYQYAGNNLPVCAISPIRHGGIACATYQQQQEWICLLPAHVTTVSELCKHTEQPTIFGGEISSEMESELHRQLGEQAIFGKTDISRIAALALLGEKHLSAEITDAVSAIQPLYLRHPHISQPKSKSAGATNTSDQNMAVIWDVDGTIVDTAELHFQAWHTVFAKMGFNFSYENFRKDFGMRNDMVIRNFLGEHLIGQDVHAISDEKNRIYRDALQPSTLRPMSGAIALLEALYMHGIPMAVASSATCQNIEIVLRVLGIQHMFQAIVSGEEVFHGKPNPEIYQKAANKLQIEARHCVVIEDAIGGITGACAAGMHSIGVAVNHPPSSLQAADVVVNTLSQISVTDIEKLIQN